MTHAIASRSNARRIGLLADLHGHQGQGPGLPESVTDALRGVDLIVPLGDMGEPWVLDRLEKVAPVLATRGGDDPREDPRIEPCRVIEAGGLRVGALFDLVAGGIAASSGEELRLRPELGRLLRERFGGAVDVVAFAATHQPQVACAQGVLFVNPGSPTLPSQGRPTLAILDLREGIASVEIVTL